MSGARNILIGLGLLLAPGGAGAEDVPYSFELSALAQRYYRLCQAEARLQEGIARDLNERQLPAPRFKSFLETLPVVNRRDAQLVCLGAAAQRLDDLQRPPVAVLPPDFAGAKAPQVAVPPASLLTKPVSPRVQPQPPAEPRRQSARRRVVEPSATLVPTRAAPAAITLLPAPASRVTMKLDAPLAASR